MTTNVETVQDLAREASGYFERAERPSGEGFIRLKEGAPEWIGELVHAAHGGEFLPDDWRYEAIEDAVEWIADNDDDDEDAAEFADANTDAYNGRLLAWLSSNLNRIAYVDDAVEDFGYPEDRGVMGAIAFGQYRELEEVYGLVRQGLADRLEEIETDETDD